MSSSATLWFLLWPKTDSEYMSDCKAVDSAAPFLSDFDIKTEFYSQFLLVSMIGLFSAYRLSSSTSSSLSPASMNTLNSSYSL
jgi:hypothetical protein